MTFINKFKNLEEKYVIFEKYSLYLNELLRASCPPPFGPAELFKFVPDELVRKNLAASASCSCIALPPTIPVGDLDRSPLFAIFSLSVVPFMQHTGKPCYEYL
jgi:hypothetical protein